jgi:hypothetical protein
VARLGVPVGGRVRKLCAVEDQSALIPEETTSKLGKINLWSLAAALLIGLLSVLDGYSFIMTPKRYEHNNGKTV